METRRSPPSRFALADKSQADAAAWYNVGACPVQHLPVFEESIDAYRRALALKPDFMQAMNNLGNALREADHFNEAISAHEQLLTHRPKALPKRALSATCRNSTRTSANRQAGRRGACWSGQSRSTPVAPRPTRRQGGLLTIPSGNQWSSEGGAARK